MCRWRCENEVFSPAGCVSHGETQMGDVFSYLFQLASMLEVDLDEMWHKHQSKIVEKQYERQNFVNAK